ncbi:MAG: hypothetical protein A2Y40_00355 [Candidatus Margulisbacteria bacterium GWF2_35_9]|nr:MAG: hypothetical protein A2Y40_00355 [Candidatus Margulisbacteria bacterium GWF2_35_9]
MSLNNKELKSIAQIFTNALEYAAERLSEISSNKVCISDTSLKMIHSDDIPLLFGNNQDIISGTYLEFNVREDTSENSIPFNGQMLLSFPIESAYRLAAILLQDLTVPLNKMQSMTNSIFGELGNIFGTGFLTFLANVAEIRLLPSVPYVINYKATPILEFVKDKLGEKNCTLLMMQTKLEMEKQPIEGHFLLITKDYQNVIKFLDKMPV